ncbi:hypothetical protein LCGC14_0817140 [marine sediment metagenome]|uniref:Uncharacterized protein n=1 Tax=marine sediment metagenome TaxID=412755 RepID=A0A0F9SSC6_9ZZZZ
MANNSGDRLAAGILEAFWALGKLAKHRPCDGCLEVMEPDELVYRPAGFFRAHDAPNVTGLDLGIRETICVECAGKRRTFLAEALAIIDRGTEKGD